MSVGQIRQMIEIMWETESPPKLIDMMEAEVLKDEKGDVIHNPDGTVISNMIGALTSMILEHWCGSETEIADKNEVILMNLKCHKMSQYDDFHRDWMQRKFEVKDSNNLLWE